MNAIICGCAFNIEEYLDIIKIKIEDLRTLFDKTIVIIYENDSTDNTLNILQNYSKHYNNIIIITENGIRNKITYRTHRLAYTRNKIIEYIFTNNLDSEYDYFINMDLDDVNINLDIKSVKKVLNDNSFLWDAVFANQTKNYYDYWALRTNKFDFNFWSIHNKKNNIDGGKLYNYFDKIKHIKIIPKDDKPKQVISAFGGFGIYKIQTIKNCKYDGNSYLKNDIIEDCEHVSFHKNMIKNGFDKLYIVPYLLNN
jgi:hypothetical protein